MAKKTKPADAPEIANTVTVIDETTGEVLSDEKNSVIVAADTMAGDLLGALLQEIKLLDKPWQQLPEHAQFDVIDRLRNRVMENVRQAVRAIADDERHTVTAELESVQFKNGCKAVFVVGGEMADRLALAENVGRPCLVVIADAAPYMGGAFDVKPEPSQKPLPTIDEPPTGEAEEATA